MSNELTPQQLEEDSHWWFASRTRALMGLLDGELADSNLRVLDVGCGAGNMIHHLSRYGTVVGIDNNSIPLEVAHRRGYDARRADAERLPFEEGKFDLVTALDVVEHCDDDLQILRECHRVCRDDGLLAVTVPAYEWLWSNNDAVNAHKRRYSRAELESKLAEAGFQTLRMTFNNFFVVLVNQFLTEIMRRLKQNIVINNIFKSLQQ